MHFKIALAGIFLAILLSHLNAESGEPLSAKEIRKAEREARTAEEHLRLAAYYESKARQAQVNLTEAEEQMKHWSWMADRTKIPNPYWSANALAGMYRAEMKKMMTLADRHRKMAEALRTGP